MICLKKPDQMPEFSTCSCIFPSSIFPVCLSCLRLLIIVRQSAGYPFGRIACLSPESKAQPCGHTGITAGQERCSSSKAVYCPSRIPDESTVPLILPHSGPRILLIRNGLDTADTDDRPPFCQGSSCTLPGSPPHCATQTGCR